MGTAHIINDLYKIITERKNSTECIEKSYTRYLFQEGLNKILKKIGEETSETIIAAKDGNTEDVIAETADLIYHLLVMLASLDIPYDMVANELEKRMEKMGNLKSLKIVDKNT